MITSETTNIPTTATPTEHNVRVETTKPMSETTDTLTTEATENVESENGNGKFITD